MPAPTTLNHPFRMSSVALFLLLSHLCTFSLLAASGHTNHFTPWHVAKLQLVTEAAIAPEGDQIAFVRSRPRQPLSDEDGTPWTELFLWREGSDPVPFVTGKVRISQPAWRPGTNQISFLSKREGDDHTSLYIIPTDGGEARRIVQADTDIQGYSWEPQGNALVYLAKEKKPDELTDLEKKGFNQEIYEEQLRPTHLWLLESLNQNEAARPEPTRLEVPGSATEVHWSPDGTLIAAAMAATPLIDDVLIRQKVHLIDPRQTQDPVVLDHASKLYGFSWSGDGNYLATVSGADQHDPSASRVLVWSKTGKLQRTFLEGFEGHPLQLVWQSNSILILTAEGAQTALREFSLDGTEKTTLLDAKGPIWVSMDPSQSGNRLALIGHTPQHPNELFLLDLPADQGSVRLTDSNDWLAEMEFARQEVVEYRASDGFQIQGVLIWPLHHDSSKRYALINSVHGGPESHVPNGWTTFYSGPGQVGAAQGFAVFYPNYRGSTGRGLEFSKLGQAEAAGLEFQDIVEGVDHLVRIGLADRARVGITGGSYGGYASAWGATYYTEHFAAAVMFVGISDNISKVGTTDIPHEMHLVHHRKWLWDDWEYFLKRSPIYYVEQARTPLLILHGKEDPRVHPGQSLELYRHLKVLGRTPVRLVLYPGEGHGNRRAASRLDYNLRLMRWMRHFLQDQESQAPAPAIDYKNPLAPEPDADADADAASQAPKAEQ